MFTTRSGLGCKAAQTVLGRGRIMSMTCSTSSIASLQYRSTSTGTTPPPPPFTSTPSPNQGTGATSTSTKAHQEDTTTTTEGGGVVDAGDIWSTSNPSNATLDQDGTPEVSPEVVEMEKDKHFLYRLGVGLFGLGLCGLSMFYGLKMAKARYMGEAESVRVGVESRGKPSLGGPFTLVSTDGVPVSQAEFLGKWTFFYFGFTHCPEICPVELNRMTRVTNDIQRERPTAPIQPLFISCDPKRDSLAAIKEYLSIFHPSFIGLVGTPNQVNEACKSYRIYYSLPDDTADEEADYLIDHSIAIFLFDPQGRFVDFFGNRYDAGEISKKVLGYIDKYTADPSWTNY